MFGMRIWLTPHEQHQLARRELALGLVLSNGGGHGWITPSEDSADSALSCRLFGASPTNPPRQVNAEPKGRARRPKRLFELAKTAGSVKPYCARIGSSDREMRAPRAHVADGSEPPLHQSAPQAAATKVWHKVDVEVRGINLDDPVRRTVWVVDPVAHELVGAPVYSGGAGRVWVNRSQGGPPLSLEPSLELASVGHADDVAADPIGVLDDKHAPRAQNGVGCGVNMPDQLWIPIEGRGVVAACACRQAYAVEVV